MALTKPPGEGSLDHERPRRLREDALKDIETRLETGVTDSEAIELRFDRACLLSELGRTSEARDSFLDVLGRAPSHRGALNNLGTLLHSTGYRTAARTAFREAAAKHPEDPMSLVNLANALRENGEFEQARERYEAALRLEPNHAEAHQGLSYVLAELGDEAGAALHRRKGFEEHAVRALPYRGSGPPVSLLLLVSSLGGNIPTRTFLNDRIFETFVAFPEYFKSGRPLPPHQVVMNAIGDADLSRPALEAAKAVLAVGTAPVINSPAAVLATGRAMNAERLARIKGVVAPVTVTLERELLVRPDAEATLHRHGLQFPLLLRTPGFHTGRHFLRVESAPELPGALAELPGRELTVMQYLDARGEDGKVRKYRVMMIDGALYPLHVAISSDWKIHYFTADMSDHPEHRAEDAEFLENMPGVVCPAGIAALREIQQTLALEYAGIDFGLNAAGEILLFEANATMVVNPPEPDPRWAYRREPVQRILDAAQLMLLDRAGPPSLA